MNPVTLVFLVLFVVVLAYSFWRQNLVAGVLALVALAILLGVFR